jgi:hypothetical protein
MRTEAAVTPGAITTKETGVNTDIGGFVAGQRSFDQAFTVDGGNASPVVWPQPLWALVTKGGISVDAIHEFRLFTTNKPPDAGGKSGSLTAITTKSGSKQFHGSAFEYLRDTILDAKGYFDPYRLPYRQYQVGGSFGGPISNKKEIFFFSNYEAFRNVQTLSKNITVPSPDLLALIPNGPAYGYLGDIYKYTFPAAATISTSNPLVGTGNAPYDNSIHKDMGLGRLDMKLSSKNQLTLRYMQVTGYNGFGAVGANGPIGSNTDEQWAGNNALIRVTTTLSPTMVNEAHADYDRHNYNFSAGPPPAELIAEGFSAAAATATSLPAIAVSGSGFPTAGNPTFLPEKRHENSFEYADTLSWSLGKHSLDFGVQYLPQQANMVAVNTLNRSVTFSGIGSTTNPASGTLLNGVFQTQLQSLLSPGDTGIKGYRERTTAAFAHDTWKATHNVAIDVGLRWTYSTPFSESHGKMNNLFEVNSSGNAIPGGDVNMGNIATAQLFTTGAGLDYTRKFWTGFAPNVGIVYDPYGNGTTAISGGYSIAFERPYMQYLYNVGSNIPYVTLSQVSSQTFGYFATLGSAAATSNPNLMVYNPSQILPYVQYWNTQLQQALGNQTVLQVMYLGSRGTHMQLEDNPNGGATYTTFHPTRPNPSFGTVTEQLANGISNYNALAVEVKREFHAGLSMKLAYTWSKSLDVGSAGTAIPTNQNSFMTDYGSSDFDTRHVFAGNVVYALPFGGQRMFGNCSAGVVCAAISGWQLSSIFSANTGQPFSVTSGSDNNQDGVTTDRSFQIGPLTNLNRVAGEPKTYFFNTAAKLTALATTGTAPQQLSRNSFYGPNYIDVDAEVRKVTHVWERLDVTFLMEAINVANHANFAPPVSTLSSATFGQLQSTVPHGGPRVYQVALRLDF